MSYCRYSSDNWKSEVYAYADCRGGYTTHVAGNKVVGEIPPDGDVIKDTPRKFAAKHRALLAFLESASRKPIGLAHDGETFNDPDLESFLDRLTALRALGYHVPDSAFAAVKDEMRESQEELESAQQHAVG